MTPNHDRTLYFLQASRSIRIAWLLEELNLPYKSIFFPRENNKAPVDFKEKSGISLAKAPVLKDGNVVSESSEYLIEKYDTNQRLMGGQDEAARNRVRMFIHAAEGIFMVHCLAITYARWFSSASTKTSGDLQKLEEGLAINVGKELDWLDKELSGKEFLAGDHVTAADTMNLFSIQFILREICVWGGRECEGTGTWRKAVEKTGHQM